MYNRRQQRHSKKSWHSSHTSAATPPGLPSNQTVNKGSRNRYHQDHNNNVAVGCSPTILPEAATKKVSKLSPHAKEFIPVAQKLKKLLDEVEEAVLFFYTKINENPSSFDILMTTIVPHFQSYLTNLQIINKFIDYLYIISIYDRAFACHAIKMLMYLINVSSVEFRCEKLQNKVILKAQTECFLVIARIHLEQINCNGILAVLSFLSELYIHFEDGNGCRQWFLGAEVAFILKKILIAWYLPTNERINTTVTIMKLTGSFLDMDDKSALDSVVDRLQMVLYFEAIHLDNQTIIAAVNLLELRNNFWGMDPSQDNNPGMIDHNEERGLAQHAQAVYIDSIKNLIINNSNEVSPNVMDGMEDAYNNLLRTIPQRGLAQHALAVYIDSMKNLIINTPNEVSPNVMDRIEDAYNNLLRTIPQRGLAQHAQAVYIDSMKNLIINNPNEVSPNVMDRIEDAYNNFLRTIPQSGLPQHAQAVYIDSTKNMIINNPKEVSPNVMDGKMEDAYNNFLRTIPQPAPVPMVYTPVCYPFLQMPPCQNGMVPMIGGPGLGPMNYNDLSPLLQMIQRGQHQDHQPGLVNQHLYYQPQLPGAYNGEDKIRRYT